MSDLVEKNINHAIKAMANAFNAACEKEAIAPAPAANAVMSLAVEQAILLNVSLENTIRLVLFHWERMQAFVAGEALRAMPTGSAIH